jgi:hypothetical protein
MEIQDYEYQQHRHSGSALDLGHCLEHLVRWHDLPDVGGRADLE